MEGFNTIRGRVRAIFILITIAVVVFAITIPALLSARIGTNEQEARVFLRRIWKAEELFRRKAFLDRNGNGTGEFGFLNQIFYCPVPKQKGEPFRDDQDFKDREKRTVPVDAKWEEDGRLIRYSGYFFSVFLPGKQGKPIERGSRDIPDSCASEKAWVGYAWPVSFGKSGKRVFSVHQDKKIIETSNSKMKYEGKENIPFPLSSYQKGSDSLFSSLAVNKKGLDNQDWRESLH